MANRCHNVIYETVNGQSVRPEIKGKYPLMIIHLDSKCSFTKAVSVHSLRPEIKGKYPLVIDHQLNK